MNIEPSDRERLRSEIAALELPAMPFEDQMLFAWAKVRQITCNESLTERDREMFMLGFAVERVQQERKKYAGPSYPPVSLDTVPATPSGEGLPMSSGIYFLWDSNSIVYVGRSRCIRDRVTLPAHHVLKGYHRVSYVLMDAAELSWAEAFYIGVLRPIKNFGKHATHRKPLLLPPALESS